MFTKFQLAQKYLHYFLTASNGKGHGIHSPFVYDFITKVLNDKRQFYAYGQVESLRDKLKIDQQKININDFGAGSVTAKHPQRSVASIARHTVKSAKWGQLLFRISNYYRSGTILELGTSLGLSTAYLALGNPQADIITVEGAPEVAAIARQNFKTLQLSKIELVQRNFDDMLPYMLQQLKCIDLVFVDGNHRKEPTLDYFQQLVTKKNAGTIFIFDDIHWSFGMEEAWLAIKAHPDVLLTIDLFFIGLVFFREEFKVKQHFVIRF